MHLLLCPMPYRCGHVVSAMNKKQEKRRDDDMVCFPG